jgi:hypothetical protein
VNTGAKLEIENQGSLVMISDTGLWLIMAP